jgi:asparagine synthase (glutamine-hydrolysing)
MCGICGFYSKFLSTYDNVILKMNLSISHRGPDSSGVWQDRNSGIVLGHQRLSIIDLSITGNQPMNSNSDRFVITYNGEIYNHLEIRRELEKISSTLQWKGSSDTETLLESIDFWGVEKTLKKIDGMFSFVVWDKKARSLTLARDRMGEKPLYYGWQGKGNHKVFLFGSELKALKTHPEFSSEVNRDAIALQLRHNCIPAPHSIYKGIYKLLPGHYLELKLSDLTNSLIPSSKSYWSLVEQVIYGNSNKLIGGEIEIQNDFEKHLQASIKKQMISDVPLGAFLSGGLDSSTVVALMQSQSSHPIKTFTIGSSQENYSEAKYAKKISQYLGTDHTELYVSSKEALDIIPKLPIIYDEPFSDSSQIPSFLVSQLAKQQVKVALSGDGGDELFCGYNRYVMGKIFSNLCRFMPLPCRKLLASWLNSMSPQSWIKILKILSSLDHRIDYRNKMQKIINVLKAKSSHDFYYTLCSHWQNPIEAVIDSNESETLLTKLQLELKIFNNQEKMMVLDSLTYLPDDILTKVDRAAMASSLETRVPFLDHKLIEYVWKIPHSLKFRDGKGKWILRKVLNKYIPKELTERPKMGFSIPIDIWLKGPLRNWAEALLNETRLKQEGYFNPKLIKHKWSEHINGKANWSYDLWDVLMFQAWLEREKK